MLREMKSEVLQVLRGCQIDGSKVLLPDGMINHDVFSIVRTALEKIGGKFKKSGNFFQFNHDVTTEETQVIITELEETACDDDIVHVPAEPETVDVQEDRPFHTITESRTLRYDFTASEVFEKSQHLAKQNQLKTNLENERSSVTSQFASKIKECSATINTLSNLVTAGYEYRDVEVEISYNNPQSGTKTIVRQDTGRTWTEKMEPYEYNLFNQPEDDLTR